VILLDTNILIDGLAYAFDPSETYVASMLSRAELELGLQRAPTSAERQYRQARLLRLDDWLTWMPFDRQASVGYGVVAGGSTFTGARLRGKDALIAGQAYSVGASVMTANTTDFEPFETVLTVVAPVPRT